MIFAYDLNILKIQKYLNEESIAVSFWYDVYLVILQVHAKHEEKSDTKSVYREYNREFLLPKGVNPEQIRSSLSKDGVLTVDAPLPQALSAGEKLIPIAGAH